MIIKAPEIKHIVDDYEFLFESGFMLPVSIDKDQGDTVEFEDKAILIYKAPRPSQSDPTRFLSAEDITIFPTHIVAINHRTREVTELGPNEKEALRKSFTDLITNSTVH
jgi:hypothetical protein